MMVQVDGEAVQYELLPEQFRGGLMRWIEYGIQPGHFLTAVLENDLFNAIGHADDNALETLPAIVRWLYWHAPNHCKGSREQVAAWGRAKRAEREREER